MTVAQSRESKFFLSQLPVSGSQNLQPNRFMPRILSRGTKIVSKMKKKRCLYASCYLKMKIKSISRPKKTATLSMVLSMTIRDRWRLGRNLTILMILSSLKVLRTPRPRPPSVTP